MTNEWPPLSSHPEEERQKALAKYRILAPYLHQQECLEQIAVESGIPKRTLYHWAKQYQEAGLKGLIRKQRSDSGHFRVEKPVQDAIRNLVLEHRKNSVASLHRKIKETCQKQNWEVPSYAQVYAVSKALSLGLKELAHRGKKEYQTHYDLIYRREAQYPNEIWQADHTPLDILVLNERGKPQRPWLTIILDDYSRAVSGYFLSFQEPSAIQTALVLHQAIWKKSNADWPVCGIPETFYTDHGSDFTSNHLEQVAIDLKINLVFSKVGEPRGRGKIERFFLTINQLFLQNLPGYLGNLANSALLTVQELDEKLARFLLYDYHHRVHGTTKEEPVSRWNKSGFLPQLPDSLESLDLLLLQVTKPRKVHPDGIHFQGLRYLDTNLAAYVGETVLIRYDPRDLAEIRVFYRDYYLCTAISPEIADYTVDLKEIVAARNQVRKNLERELHPGKTVAEELVRLKQPAGETAETKPDPKKPKLKRYFNE